MSERKSPIPIKNLFYMLCYAWNVLTIQDDILVGTDDYEDAYNLLGRVFAHGIGKLIRSGFHRSYIRQEEELAGVRGKVNIQESINRLSPQRKRLYCEYDEYSANVPFNQILAYTIEALLRNPGVDISIKKILKKQKEFFVGIDATPPTKANRKKLVYNRNNMTYKLLISIAIMLYDNTTINEEDGSEVFQDFFREEQMHKVFELFILNFYSMHLPKSEYKVHAPKIRWHIEDDAEEIFGDFFDVDTDIGDRRTDIVVENRKENIQMIMDAKFYQNTLVAGYMSSAEDSVRTGHLNQIRGYMIDSEFDGTRIGALVYPMTKKDLDRGILKPIKGQPIIIKTLNLANDWKTIEQDMLKFVANLEGAAKKFHSHA